MGILLGENALKTVIVSCKTSGIATQFTLNAEAIARLTPLQLLFTKAAMTITDKREYVGLDDTLNTVYHATGENTYGEGEVALAFFGNNENASMVSAIAIGGPDGKGTHFIYLNGNDVNWFGANLINTTVTEQLKVPITFKAPPAQELIDLLAALDLNVLIQATSVESVPSSDVTFEQLFQAVFYETANSDSRMSIEEAARGMFNRLSTEVVLKADVEQVEVPHVPMVNVIDAARQSMLDAEALAAATPIGLPDTYTGGPTSVQMLDDTEIGADAVVPEVPAGVVIRGGRVEQPGARRNRR